MFLSLLSTRNQRGEYEPGEWVSNLIEVRGKLGRAKEFMIKLREHIKSVLPQHVVRGGTYTILVTTIKKCWHQQSAFG